MHDCNRQFTFGAITTAVACLSLMAMFWLGWCWYSGSPKVVLSVLPATTVDLKTNSIRYDQATWLCTHNAFNASEEGFRFSNQTHGIARQLNDGVSALMLDVWDDDGEIVLRHGEMFGNALGTQPLEQQLKVIAEYLDSHRQAIITLIFESYVPASAVVIAFEKADLIRYCHAQDPSKEWPTLDAMRRADKRLVVFSDNAEGGSLWYMPVWDHCFETHWKASSLEQLLENRPGRGHPDNALFIANHFLGQPMQLQQAALTANAPVILRQRFKSQGTEPLHALPKQPNFIVVDFYELGDCQEWCKPMPLRILSTDSNR